jgi:hypothetical protein
MNKHLPAEFEGAQTKLPTQNPSSMEGRLETISESHAQLASSRRQLLITRERVRTASRNVRLKRVGAGDAEAAFMNQLREFVNKSRDELPKTLLDAYNTVTQTRDDLGEIEENYLQAERNLTGAEWTFMDQENAFYQIDLWDIINGYQSDDSMVFQGETYMPPTRPLFPNSFPPTSDTIPYLVERSNAGTFSDLPHLSPLPPICQAPAVLEASSLPMVANQAYAVKIAEVEKLRKRFDRMRQKEACSIEWQEGDEVLFADGIESAEIDSAASVSEYFNILHQLSACEASAQQLKVLPMAGYLEAPGLARRYSDPASPSAVMQSCSVSMRRTQTESAVCLMKDDSTTKEKIREWSLTYLKDSAVQKCLYLNALEDCEVVLPVDDDWKERATRYWSKDSLGESEYGDEHDAASTNGISYEPGSCTNEQVSQSAAASSIQQKPNQEATYPCDRTTSNLVHHGLYEKVHGDTRDIPSIPNLSTSLSTHHQARGDTQIRDESLLVPSKEFDLDQQQRCTGRNISANGAEYVPCTCPPEYGNAAHRKDSVQSANIGHHSSCAMAQIHKLEPETRITTNVAQGSRSTKKPPTSEEHLSLMQSDESSDPYASISKSVEFVQNACAQSEFGPTAPLTSSSQHVHTSTASFPVDRTPLQYDGNSFKSDLQSKPHRRRSSSSWFRTWFSRPKDKRSVSSPSIEVHRPGVRARKQSVA